MFGHRAWLSWRFLALLEALRGLRVHDRLLLHEALFGIQGKQSTDNENTATVLREARCPGAEPRFSSSLPLLFPLALPLLVPLSWPLPFVLSLKGQGQGGKQGQGQGDKQGHTRGVP